MTPPDDEEINDYATYGIDWDVADDPTLMNHLLQQNPQDWADSNPFATGPDSGQLSHVECEPPGSPFSLEQIAHFDDLLHQSGVDLLSRNMGIRRLVWKRALDICREMYAQFY